MADGFGSLLEVFAELFIGNTMGSEYADRNHMFKNKIIVDEQIVYKYFEQVLEGKQ